MGVQAMGQETSGTTRSMDAGRKPIRASPILANERLARLLRDLSAGGRGEMVAAAREFRHIAGNGVSVSEAFLAFLAALRSGDRDIVHNLLWAVRYAKLNGADISALQPTIEELRYSEEGTTRSLATLVLNTTPSAE
ncbi:MAG: hypothetical protein AB1657_03420 [Candidatus Micrarchaeota archaeon]